MPLQPERGYLSRAGERFVKMEDVGEKLLERHYKFRNYKFRNKE